MVLNHMRMSIPPRGYEYVQLIWEPIRNLDADQSERGVQRKGGRTLNDTYQFSLCIIVK